MIFFPNFFGTKNFPKRSEKALHLIMNYQYPRYKDLSMSEDLKNAAQKFIFDSIEAIRSETSAESVQVKKVAKQGR